MDMKKLRTQCDQTAKKGIFELTIDNKLFPLVPLDVALKEKEYDKISQLLTFYVNENSASADSFLHSQDVLFYTTLSRGKAVFKVIARMLDLVIDAANDQFEFNSSLPDPKKQYQSFTNLKRELEITSFAQSLLISNLTKEGIDIRAEYLSSPSSVNLQTMIAKVDVQVMRLEYDLSSDERKSGTIAANISKTAAGVPGLAQHLGTNLPTNLLEIFKPATEIYTNAWREFIDISVALDKANPPR